MSKSKLKKWIATGALVTGSVVGAGFMITRGELVTEVIDGDSFKLANKQTIRLASLNAPEVEYCMGEESKEALTAMILNKRVVLRDVKTDIYRRILALVYVDGKLVNEQMIRKGLAVTTREAADENPAVSAANDHARNNKIGVYSAECYQPTPPDPNCLIKGNVNDRGLAKEYFLPRCRHYSKVIIERNFGEEWFCTEAQAKKAGFVYAPGCE